MSRDGRVDAPGPHDIAGNEAERGVGEGQSGRVPHEGGDLVARLERLFHEEAAGAAAGTNDEQSQGVAAHFFDREETRKSHAIQSPPAAPM